MSKAKELEYVYGFILFYPFSRDPLSSPDFDPHDLPIVRTKDGAIVVNNVAWTLEWVLSSPPPLHCFLEPPIIVEWPEGEDGSH